MVARCSVIGCFALRPPPQHHHYRRHTSTHKRIQGIDFEASARGKWSVIAGVEFSEVVRVELLGEFFLSVGSLNETR